MGSRRTRCQAGACARPERAEEWAGEPVGGHPGRSHPGGQREVSETGRLTPPVTLPRWREQPVPERFRLGGVVILERSDCASGGSVSAGSRCVFSIPLTVSSLRPDRFDTSIHSVCSRSHCHPHLVRACLKIDRAVQKGIHEARFPIRSRRLCTFLVHLDDSVPSILNLRTRSETILFWPLHAPPSPAARVRAGYWW